MTIKGFTGTGGALSKSCCNTIIGDVDKRTSGVSGKMYRLVGIYCSHQYCVLCFMLAMRKRSQNHADRHANHPTPALQETQTDAPHALPYLLPLSSMARHRLRRRRILPKRHISHKRTHRHRQHHPPIIRHEQQPRIHTISNRTPNLSSYLLLVRLGEGVSRT